MWGDTNCCSSISIAWVIVDLIICTSSILTIFGCPIAPKVLFHFSRLLQIGFSTERNTVMIILHHCGNWPSLDMWNEFSPQGPCFCWVTIVENSRSDHHWTLQEQPIHLTTARTQTWLPSFNNPCLPLTCRPGLIFNCSRLNHWPHMHNAFIKHI